VMKFIGSDPDPFAVTGDIHFERTANSMIVMGEAAELQAVAAADVAAAADDAEPTFADANLALMTGDYPPVVFPHWKHRIRFKCSACHPQIFEMKKGANEISMDTIRQGRFCAECHNGDVAFEVTFQSCYRCHEPQ